ncbi:MAG: hypothetical protein HYR85_06220 [Planctomycetes bacterium]|nr:hypothetical protein [Planctomycetota bacterium]MBI3843024.1 hypothetical protein [Planctomycetota bacterium]
MSTIRLNRPVTAVRIVSTGSQAAAAAKPGPPPVDVAAGKLEAALRECTRAIAEIRGRFESLGSELEREAVALALAAAERVLGEELRDGRARIESLLGPAIEQALARRGGGSVVVRLNPDDVDTLRKRSPDFIAKSGTEFRADAGVARGSAVVDTLQGPIEAGVHVAMNRIREELLGGPA